jgi:DNA-binding CsgD family transcriptional regulator
VTRLTDIEASRLQEALTQLYAVVPLAAFPDRALAVARQLIACIHCSYNEIDVARGRHRIVADPPELLRHPAAARFPRYVHQHPVIGHYAATGDSRSHLISDFLTATEFRRLELYDEFFRPLDTESQLSATLSSDRGRCVIGLAFNRGREGFDERDRLLLDLLRPHLLVAHDNASKLTAAFVGTHPFEGSGGAETLDRLTGRQRQILRLLAAGRTNARIAFELDISPATVKKHVEHILDRLDVSTRTAAAARYLGATAVHEDDRRDG